MSGIPGTNVAAMVVPIDTADLYATHSDKYGRGGFRVEDTTLTRDAITTLRRREGMWVRVLADGKLYQLGSGLSNADWSEVTLGGNATGVNTGDETTATIKTKLGITTLSGSNTGDQVIPTTLPASDVSAWAKAATKPAYTYTEVGAQVAGDYITGIGSASGSNTGDETTATIKTKLGITTLSGSNTGDETTATIKTKLGITTLSGSNTGDNAANTLYSGLVSNATHTGDATGATALTVIKLNGTLLSGLATGVLKNTTATGVPSIATGADLPAMSATAGGAVPTPPNNTTTFLRGDGTFATPPAASIDLDNDIVVHGVTVGRGASAGDNNTVLGESAGAALTYAVDAGNTSGYHGDLNTFMGYWAGSADTTGQRNTAVGVSALGNNTTGGRNTAVGAHALVGSLTATRTTAVGSSAGANTDASTHNVFVGSFCGMFTTTGSYNTFLGDGAGSPYPYVGGSGPAVAGSNVTGEYNTFLGADSVGAATTDSNSIVIGANAVGLGSNTTVIGNASTTRTTLMGGLNLPTAGGRITGDFSNAAVASRVMFQGNVVNGISSVEVIPNGTSTSGQFVASNNSDANNASIIQLLSNITEASIRASQRGTGAIQPMTFYTGGLERMRIDAAGNVAIGVKGSAGSLMLKATDNVAEGGDMQFEGAASFTNCGVDNYAGQLRLITASSVLMLAPGGVYQTAPAGLGYGAGAGGSVTQATSKSTAVTLNKPCGEVKMHNAALAAGASAVFVVNNAVVGSTDTFSVGAVWGAADPANYRVEPVSVGVSTLRIRVTNISAVSLAEELIINFAIHKGSVS